MASYAQDTEIPQNLQRLVRELFQDAVYHVQLLQRPVHPEKTVLLDQPERCVDELEHSNVERIECGPVETSFEPTANDPTSPPGSRIEFEKLSMKSDTLTYVALVQN